MGTSTTEDVYMNRANFLKFTYKVDWDSRLCFIYDGNRLVMKHGRKLSSLAPLYTPDVKYITMDGDTLWLLLGFQNGTRPGKTAFGKH